MLPKVAIGRPNSSVQTNIESYRMLVGDEIIDELLVLARSLRNVRICHINSTAYGGGVAELLARYLPLLQGLGISAEWRLIHGDPAFFTVTKAFHNALQGVITICTNRSRRLILRSISRALSCLTPTMTWSSYTIPNRPPFVTSPVPEERSGSGAAISTALRPIKA